MTDEEIRKTLNALMYALYKRATEYSIEEYENMGYRKVILCKDCKHYGDGCCYHLDGMRWVEDDDYCSRGEEK